MPLKYLGSTGSLRESTIFFIELGGVNNTLNPLFLRVLDNLSVVPFIYGRKTLFTSSLFWLLSLFASILLLLLNLILEIVFLIFESSYPFNLNTWCRCSNSSSMWSVSEILCALVAMVVMMPNFLGWK